MGGPVWDSNAFSKSVTYRPTLSKFKGGPVKKITLYIIFEEPGLIAATTEDRESMHCNAWGHLSVESRIWALTKYTWTSLWITWDRGVSTLNHPGTMWRGMGRGKEADKGLGKISSATRPDWYTLSQIAQWVMIRLELKSQSFERWFKAI